MLESFPQNPIDNNQSSGTQVKKSLEVSKQESVKPASHGYEKNNYVNISKPNELIKEYHVDIPAEQLKKRHYLHKLLNLIYPDNFPEVKMTLPNHKIEVFEKVDKNINPIRNLIQKPIAEMQLVKKLEELGLDIDTGSQNFMLGKDNKLKYVDSIDAYDDTAEKIEKFVNLNLEGEKKIQALDLIEKLKSVKKKNIAA